MKKVFPLILLTSILFLIGCAAMQHRQAGDKYLKAKNYEMAVTEYQKALQLKPEFSQNTEFKSRFKTAQSEYHYENGMKQKTQGLWDKAIEELKKALEIDPGHALAKREISDARVKSSKAHYKKGLTYADRGKLYKAIEELRQSIELNPDNMDAKKALEIAIKTKKENERKAHKHFKIGMGYFKDKNLSQSLDEFMICLGLDPNHVLARAKIKEAKDQIDAAQDRYQKGLGYFQKKDWDQAILQFKETLTINPYHPKAQEKIDKVESQKATAEKFYLNGEIYFSQRFWDKSIKEYKRALDVNPNHTRAKNMLEEALEEGAKQHCSVANEFLNNHRFQDAAKEFELALDYVPNFGPAKKGLVEVYYQNALGFEQRGKIGNALIEFKKTFQMIQGYKNCSDKIVDIEEEIKKRISYRVALLPFKNSSRERGIADVVGEGVLVNLISSKIENIEIIERAYLERILEEQKLSMTGLVDHETVVPVGKIKGVDAIITGNVLNFELYSDKRMESRSERYQSGTRREFNPEYDEARRDYEDAMRNYERALREKEELERKQREAERRRREAEERQRSSKGTGAFSSFSSYVGSTMSSINLDFVQMSHGISLSGAQMALSSAKSKLDETPMYIDVPEYSYWSYNIYHCKKEASLNVSSRVVDTLTGKVLFAETIRKNIKEKDDYIDNPNPSAGVNSDPLELASDAEMKERVINDGVLELSECICSSLGEYGIRYFILAEKEAIHNEIENAVEEYVNFLYSSPKRASSELAKARNFFKIHRNYVPEDWKAESHRRYRKYKNRKPPSFKAENKEIPKLAYKKAAPIISGVTEIKLLGVEIQNITPDLAKHLNLNKARGVLVTEVTQDSPAAKAGMKRGDIIVTFDANQIDDIDDLIRRVRRSSRRKIIKCEIIRKGYCGVVEIIP